MLNSDMTVDEQKFLAMCVVTTCICLILFTLFVIRETRTTSISQSPPSPLPSVTGVETAEEKMISSLTETAEWKLHTQNNSAADLGFLYAGKGDIELALDHLTVGM